MSSRLRRLVLASRSPQRSAILTRLGIAFETRPTGAEELQDGEPEPVALENARRKARLGHALGAATAEVREGHVEELVLGVDTLVVLEGHIYGKPSDEQQARQTLRALSGATHTVVGGLALIDGHDERTAVARTRVRFRNLSEQMIDWYLSTGEWRERAGGYAIQAAGAALVREIEGDYANVVGLPLATLLDLCPELL